jgi:prepilin-type N-terminal cleavage/methylation domain-containing protein/prepilin-type processing-associated H-X9-DG protein
MAPRHIARSGRGFTLVELLVVITIIGILVGLLLTAVQSAREASRNNQCRSNLKQLALGATQHESVIGFLPSGGWGWSTIGDPDRGYGATQPGGWLYNLLPFIDPLPLHDLGVGINYSTAAGARQQLAVQMVQTALPIANCPTRRRPALFACGSNAATNYGGVNLPANNQRVARTDYAACSSDSNTYSGPSGTGYHTLGTEIDGGASDPGYGNVTVPYDGPTIDTYYQQFTGTCFRCSEIKLAMIKGGTDNTILLGDKYDISDDYYNGASLSENENMYVGFDNDIYRLTCVPPMSDRVLPSSVADDPNIKQTFMFGGAHSAGANFAFCDGSVRALSYNIDPPTFQQLGRRVKTLPVDESKIK